MNLTKKDISNVSHSIKNTLKNKRMNASDLARKTNVHKTQVSKFINGQFKRYSNNLHMVCIELQIDEIKSSKPENQINKAIIDIWDGSASHADKLTKLIREVGPMLQ